MEGLCVNQYKGCYLVNNLYVCPNPRCKGDLKVISEDEPFRRKCEKCGVSLTIHVMPKWKERFGFKVWLGWPIKKK